MFIDKLTERIAQLGTPLCIGLDPSLALVPDAFLSARGLERDSSDPARCADALYDYSRDVLDAVSDLVAIVKPQSAYFEVYGSHGIRALERTIAEARARGLLVLLDAKRGDIPETSEAYAKAYLTRQPQRAHEVDALTVSPYLGEDSLAPYLRVASETGKGVFVCARTSNPGAGDLQDLELGDRTVSEIVGGWVAPWSARTVGRLGYSGLGVVVGASNAQQAARLRKRLPQSLFLVPGFGAQGGSIAAVKACFDADGRGAIVNVSRRALYPHLYEPAADGGGVDLRRTVQHIVEELRRGLA